MERLLNQNDVRMGMQVSRNKHGDAPDAQRLADVANLALEAMHSGTVYYIAVKNALREAGIENCVAYLFWTALPPIVGRNFSTFPLRKPAPPKQEPRAQNRWSNLFRDKRGHMRDATRMMYERGDHLLSDP